MSQVAHQAGTYPSFYSMELLEVFLLPLDGMLVHHRITPNIKFTGTHSYTWVERDTVRVKCLAQEHNIILPVRTHSWTSRSQDELTNHKVTARPQKEYSSKTIVNRFEANQSWTCLSINLATHQSTQHHFQD